MGGFNYQVRKQAVELAKRLHLPYEGRTTKDILTDINEQIWTNREVREEYEALLVELREKRGTGPYLRPGQCCIQLSDEPCNHGASGVGMAANAVLIRQGRFNELMPQHWVRLLPKRDTQS